MMLRNAQLVRKAVAICLAVLLSCQTALAGRCVRSERPGECIASCTCRSDLTHRNAGASCAGCLQGACSGTSEPGDVPVHPCHCQCHQAPLAALPQSSVTVVGLSDLVQFFDFPSHILPAVHGNLSLSAIRLLDVGGAWSPLDTCVLFCRFLA